MRGPRETGPRDGAVERAAGVAQAEQDRVRSAAEAEAFGVVGVRIDLGAEEPTQLGDRAETADAGFGVEASGVVGAFPGEVERRFGVGGVGEGFLDRGGGNVIQKIFGQHLDLRGNVHERCFETRAREGVRGGIAVVLR